MAYDYERLRVEIDRGVARGVFVHLGDDTRRTMCGRFTQERPTSELAAIFDD